MSNLTESERGQIIGLYKGGGTVSNISKTLKFARTTVTRTIKNFLERDSVKELPRSGRPKHLNADYKNELKKIVKKENRKSAEQIKDQFNENTGLHVSTKTIRRSLHDLNIYSRVPVSKPLINEQQRINRLNWCIERKDWSIRKWKNVIWSDESRFTLFKTDGPGRVWRTPGTRYNIENISPTIKHGGGGIMVWGCFSGKGLGPLIKVEGKMNSQDYIQILELQLLPLLHKDFNNRGYLFQDDNAPVHTAKIVKNWIETNKVKILKDWPSQSPDLNPIEHLWNQLEIRIRKRPNKFKNNDELETALREEWNQIPRNIYMNLIESMPKRIEAVISNNGWPTRY